MIIARKPQLVSCNKATEWLKKKEMTPNLCSLVVLVIGIGMAAASTTVLVSQRVVSNGTLGPLANTDNVPLNQALVDTTSWWNSTANHWKVDQTGFFELNARATFDQAAIHELPTDKKFDHQLQVRVNDAFPTNLFLGTYTARGDNSTVFQVLVKGSHLYQLESGDTVSIVVQTRIYPVNVVDSYINGGAFALTEGTLRFIGP